MAFENSAGLGNRNHYGPRKIDQSFGGGKSTDGFVKRVVAEYNLGSLISGAPSTSNVLTNPDGVGEMEAMIPAYAIIRSVSVVVDSAISTTGGSAASSASIQVGLDKLSDGTAIDADG